MEQSNNMSVTATTSPNAIEAVIKGAPRESLDPASSFPVG